MMPGLDGFGVIDRLRQAPDTRTIPIVVLTAKSLTGEEAAHLQAGVARVIQKQGLASETLIHALQRASSSVTTNSERKDK
jgi:CheY-like chemotaxis protein